MGCRWSQVQILSPRPNSKIFLFFIPSSFQRIVTPFSLPSTILKSYPYYSVKEGMVMLPNDVKENAQRYIQRICQGKPIVGKLGLKNREGVDIANIDQKKFGGATFQIRQNGDNYELIVSSNLIAGGKISTIFQGIITKNDV